MLYKTNWSGELRAWSGKINLIDTSTNSPHYFYWKYIGTRNEINNNLILGFKGLKSSPPKVVDYEWWLFTRGLNCGALTRKKLVGYLRKMVSHGGLSVLVNLILKSVMHVQSCCFTNINLLLFCCPCCRHHRPLLVWSRNVATMIMWRHTSPLRNTHFPFFVTVSKHVLKSSTARGFMCYLLTTQ